MTTTAMVLMSPSMVSALMLIRMRRSHLWLGFC
jgi:hypothetical protein